MADRTRHEAEVVLALLAAHGDDLLGVLADERLDEALAPFREDMPRLVRCPKPGCRGKIVSIAIHPHEPSVIGKQDAQVSDKQLAKRRRAAQLQTTTARDGGLPAIYRNWSVAGGRRTIGEAVDTNLDENERLRWIVTCRKPKCRTPYLVTNTELLALLIQAHLGGPGDIALPASCEVGRDWKVSLQPQSR